MVIISFSARKETSKGVRGPMPVWGVVVVAIADSRRGGGGHEVR